MISAAYNTYHKTIESLFNQKNSSWDNFLEVYDKLERLINLYVDLTHYYTYDIIFTFLFLYLDDLVDMEYIETFLNRKKGNYRRQHPEAFVISEYKSAYVVLDTADPSQIKNPLGAVLPAYI